MTARNTGPVFIFAFCGGKWRTVVGRQVKFTLIFATNFELKVCKTLQAWRRCGTVLLCSTIHKLAKSAFNGDFGQRYMVCIIAVCAQRWSSWDSQQDAFYYNVEELVEGPIEKKLAQYKQKW